MTDKELLNLAIKAREFSYSPYSHYRVGAALLSKNGKVYTGCNIENSSYSPSVCAERCAFFKAVSEGVKEFESIAIVGGFENELSSTCTPCGVCRQVMSEFCRGDFKIVLGTPDNIKTYTLNEILPLQFKDLD